MLHKITLFFGGLLLACAGTTHATDAAKWVAGQNYEVISPAAPNYSGDKIEVVEVFSYACPHCAHFQPYAERIKAGLPAGAIYVNRPAVFFDQWEPFARAFLTAKAMGVMDKTHQALFDALHRDRKPIHTLQDLANFYAQHGVNPDEFMSTAESFVIGTELQRDVAWERQCGVNGTPTIIIDGKYRLDAPSAGGNEQVVELTQWLVNKELKARGKGG